MDERLKPAFLGGLFIGVLSALPLVNMGNCCCCLWVLAGGALTVYLRQQNTPFSVPAAEGAIMGLIAGAIGGAMATVLAIPLQFVTAGFNQEMMDQVLSNPDVPQELRDLFQQTATGPIAVVLMLIINLVVMSIFGTLGGLLGVAIFKKTPPPPPPGTVEVLPPS